MIEEGAVRDALVAMFRAGISHWSILVGVARALSIAGKKRLEIVNFFWYLMNASPPVLAEDQIMLVYDFTDALLGRCPLAQIVRLHGDPDNPQELSSVVGADADRWTPPSGELTH